MKPRSLRPQQARSIHDAAPAARKRFVTFAGVGHESYLGKRRAEWLDEVRRFVTAP